jgi:hypothetical protein
MHVFARHIAVAALVGTLLMPGAGAAQGQTATGSARGPQSGFGQNNLQRIERLLAEAPKGSGTLDDYYFVAVGDIQNNVRSYSRPAFEAIAGDIRGAVDERTGLPVYDKIGFVVLLGDLVYQGPNDRQWENLEGTLRGKGLDGVSYPNIARLVADKPVFPAIGNHELLAFRPKIQNRYKDLFNSPTGVADFKRFFGWDRFIANPRILYPVPTDLSSQMYQAVVEKNPASEDRRALAASYARGPDGRFHLSYFDRPPLVEAEFAAGKARLAETLAPLFRRAGYGTLPVINSDNMVAYGVDAGNTIFLFLDSMARGWHYPGLARLKQALYPNKLDQHRLNLFSESPFNGQADFYRAVSAYARRAGKSVVPMMHHSVISGSKNIHAAGLGYNFWLALGLPQAPGEPGDATLLDEIFSDASYMFSGCVHGFERFSVVSSSPGRPDHTLRWFVSGGGGGPLTSGFHPERLKDIETLYNQKRASMAGSGRAPSIAIVDDTSKASHHYLLVHVQHGRIVDVSPRFVDKATFPRVKPAMQVTLKTSYYSSTSSAGASVELAPGAWGLERVRGYLAFVNWRPSISLGMIGDAGGPAGWAGASRAAVIDVSPLTLDVYIPGSKIVTLRPIGVELWTGSGGRRDYFITTGVELPILYNAWSRLPKLTLGLHAYIPVGSGPDHASTSAHRAGLGISIGYRITR